MSGSGHGASGDSRGSDGTYPDDAVARGRRLASPSNWHYCSPRWLPMAEPGVRAGASSKLLTAARGGAREHLSSAGWVCCGVCEATESKKRIPLARTPLPRRGDLDDITADSRPAPLSRHPRSALPLELPYTPASACRYLVFETARKEKCQLSFARGPRSARCSLRSAHAAF